MDLFTLALAKGFAKSYADKLLCGITSVRVEDTTIYFTITETGEEVSVSLPVPKDGVSIVAVDIDDNNYLVCTFSDGTTSKSSKPIEFEIEGTSGEDNKIESISVNGKEVVPDTNKNVDIKIPTVSQEEGNQIEQKDDGLFVSTPKGISYTAGTGIQIGEDKVVSTKDIKKNYIDNSNFRINQNGQSEYSTPNEYTVDRWYIDGGTLIPVENGVQFVNPNTESGSSTLIRLRQNIHYGFSEFAGKTLTLSAKINGTILTATATIPAEKPTEGTAAQYITSGIADFSINLNYSVTADYFVPYIAVAYGRTVLIEWMKLEVNGEFSGYIEPDYMTELIKMNFTTPDKGALDIPAGGESYDDTGIKEDIATLEEAVSNKLDKNGSADNLEYIDYSKELKTNTEIQINPAFYPTYGTITELNPIIPEAPQLYGFKKISDKYYFYGMSYLGYTDNLSTLSADTITSIITQQSNIGGLPIRDICLFYDGDTLVYLLCDGYNAYSYTTLAPNTVNTINFADGSGKINNFITIGDKIYGLDTTNNNIYFFNQEMGGIWELDFEMGKTITSSEIYAQDSNGCVVVPLINDIAYYVSNEGMWHLASERDGFASMETIKHIVCLDDVFHYLTETRQQGQNTWDNSRDMWKSLPWDTGIIASGEFTGEPNDGYMFGGNGMLFFTQAQELWFADSQSDYLRDIMGNIVVQASTGSLPYIYNQGVIYLLTEYSRMVKIEFVVEEKKLTEDVSALKNKIKALELLVKDLSVRIENAGF